MDTGSNPKDCKSAKCSTGHYAYDSAKAKCIRCTDQAGCWTSTLECLRVDPSKLVCKTAAEGYKIEAGSGVPTKCADGASDTLGYPETCFVSGLGVGWIVLIVAGSLFVLTLVGVGIYMALRWRTISNKSAPKAPKGMYAVDGKERDERSPKARLPGRRQDTEQALPSDWSRMYAEAQGPPALGDAVGVFRATQDAEGLGGPRRGPACRRTSWARKPAAVPAAIGHRGGSTMARGRRAAGGHHGGGAVDGEPAKEPRRSTRRTRMMR